MVNLTPGMQQYMRIKNEHPECIIFFRMGDFYETFYSDAVTVSRELEITLTSRGKGETKAPLAGIPYHSLDPYLAKLIKKGYKVGIVEQVEDPKLAKGLVKRELVRIITPGTVLESLILNQGTNNYILSLAIEDKNFGISFCDISTGEFFVARVERNKLISEIKKIMPSEIVIPISLKDSDVVNELKNSNFLISEFDDRFYFIEKAVKTIKEHFKILTLEGFGINENEIICSAGALIGYLLETQKKTLFHINKITRHNLDEKMYLDSYTIRNLELIKNLVLGSSEGTLIGVLDKTLTAMGKRLMKKWILSPLILKDEIFKRQEAVEELKMNVILRQELLNKFSGILDIERLIGRVSFGNANPKDLIGLKNSLKILPLIKNELGLASSFELRELSQINEMKEICDLIERAIKEEPNTLIREGNVIKSGYNQELDELREIKRNVKDYLAELEENEKKRTGIKSLKIRYNKIFGYFIEVTKSNLELVPEDYIRRQTQVNSERFVTDELKEKESKILSAQERILDLEFELFIDVLEKIKKNVVEIQEISKKIAKLDCYLSLAQIASKNNYIKPIFNEEGIININSARHPVVEENSNLDFIPNDCFLSLDERTMIITGPNLAGKSTFLRQCALIILMAQIGSFVPAKFANLSIVDRIFSRIGAYDDLVHGQSTFMVEMTETANILNNATNNSFVILDEIGRGTSTYDGVSLAWAIAKYLNNVIRCKTLFATHYHHLNEMEKSISGIKNYNVLVQEKDDEIVFLRKIVRGSTDKSYGIQVAKLAGIPVEVVENAKEIMNIIEIEDKIGERIIKELRG